jgi:AraC-like DNA-binding protein
MPVLDTADLGAATRALSDEYSDLAISTTRADAAFRMQLSSAEAGAVRVANLTLSHARIRTRPLVAYVVALPVAGRVVASTARDGRVGITGSTGIVSTAGREVTVDYDGDNCGVLTAQFDKRALEDELAALLGHQLSEPLEFAFRLPDAPTAGSLRRVVELLRDGAGHPVIRRRVDSLAMAALLVGQRHNYTDELSAPVGAQGPRTIRAAVSTVEEHPLDILTVADLARASHLSVRALEAGFRRHVGMPPMAYVREIRMRRAHEDLLAADPDSTTATEIAARWGFAHYGRFAAAYAERFGRPPGKTLRNGN